MASESSRFGCTASHKIERAMEPSPAHHDISVRDKRKAQWNANRLHLICTSQYIFSMSYDLPAGTCKNLLYHSNTPLGYFCFHSVSFVSRQRDETRGQPSFRSLIRLFTVAKKRATTRHGPGPRTSDSKAAIPNQSKFSVATRGRKQRLVYSNETCTAG